MTLPTTLDHTQLLRKIEEDIRESSGSSGDSSTALGATSGAKVVTDANGTIQQYLRGLVTFFANALGAGNAAAAHRVTLASDDPAVTVFGAKTDAKSSATDGTSISIQQVLKQISASVQAISPGGASAAVSVTRMNDTNAYLANDVIGAATGSTAALTFASIGPSGGEVTITSVSLEIDAAAIISGETSYVLYLYNVTPPSALGDNAPWDLPSGDRASYLGFINLGTTQDLGSTLYVQTDGVNKQIKLASTSLFGYLVTNGAHTPTAQRVYVITLHTM